jgi:leader peptidase (prepilin peptidase) / N-methyltransferase
MPFFLAWGSFLNMLAYRLISRDSLLRSRSFCPSCNTTIAWYDLIPLLSWIFLNGKCRSCSAPISWLYFFIEALAAVSFSALIFLEQPQYAFAYFLFFSALIITIRTDLEHMLISRFATLFLIPFGFMFSYFGLLPLTITQSIIGTLSGYLFLYAISALFFVITKKVGLGQGDIELLAFIGSFLGVTGWWITLMLGSFIGSIIGLLYMFFSKQNHSVKIPFGPFLAFGAMFYIVFEQKLCMMFFAF